MANEATTYDGEVVDVLPNGHYKVKLHEMDFVVEGYKAGKMKKNRISILLGDRVQIEINEYDVTKGRIVFRYKSNPHATPTFAPQPPRAPGPSRNPRQGGRPGSRTNVNQSSTR